MVNILPEIRQLRTFKHYQKMNFNNFTIKSQEAVQKAVELVQSNGQQVVETPHLLKGIMLTGEEVLQFLFGKTE